MSTEDIKSSIIKYLAKFFPAHEISEGDDIFGLGFVNSMFALQLVNFIENEFGVVVENEDMDLDNFRTIGAMVAFVGRKSGIAA